MSTPTPEEAREALDKLIVYANNGWGSACPMTNHEPAIKQVAAGAGRSTMYLESNV